MRATVVLIATAVVFLLGLAGFAQPAAAKRAEPFRSTGCSTSPGGFETCYDFHGVVKYHKSGDLSLAISTHCFTTTKTPPGEVVHDVCTRGKTIIHELHGKDSGFGNSHSSGRSTVSFPGRDNPTECTYSYNNTYANGEYRHDVSHAECHPLR